MVVIVPLADQQALVTEIFLQAASWGATEMEIWGFRRLIGSCCSCFEGSSVSLLTVID